MRKFSRRPSAGEMAVTAALMVCMVAAVAAIGIRLARSGSSGENQKVELEDIYDTAENTEQDADTDGGEEDTRIETTGESVVNEGIPEEFIADSAELPMDLIAAEDQMDGSLDGGQASLGDETSLDGEALAGDTALGGDKAADGGTAAGEGAVLGEQAALDSPEADGASSQEETQAQETAAGAVSPQAELSFQAGDKLSWPVRGNVVLDYSMDGSIYFPTLEQYKYNPAVVISGEVGTEVRSAAGGTVASIREDAQTGTTVVMDLGGGYQAVYGQLGDVAVSEGSYVARDTVLGYISEPTKYYTVEGSNLYFQVTKDGEPVDPLDYLE